MKWKREDITPEILRELLDYDPETGVLTWKERDRKWFPTDKAYLWWNIRFANQPAFTCIDDKGYLRGRVLKISFAAHRVGWAIYYNVWPTLSLDHINQNPADNRVVNLREATNAENCQNQGLRRVNTSGYLGVHRRKTGKWIARLSSQMERRYLGQFNTAEEAARAYDKAALQFHGEFASINFPEAA